MTQQAELDAAEIEAEMARDPLSHALLQNAVLRVRERKLIARIAELEQQKAPAPEGAR